MKDYDWDERDDFPSDIYYGWFDPRKGYAICGLEGSTTYPAQEKPMPRISDDLLLKLLSSRAPDSEIAVVIRELQAARMVVEAARAYLNNAKAFAGINDEDCKIEASIAAYDAVVGS